MSTLPVVEEILRKANQPLSVREIVERAGAALPTKSKTPDTVVARDLAMDIKRKAEASLFVRSSPGRYTLRAYMAGAQAEAAEPAPATAPAAPPPAGATILSSHTLGERAGTLPAPQAAKSSNEDSSMSA